jgi:hypothetical protein
LFSISIYGFVIYFLFIHQVHLILLNNPFSFTHEPQFSRLINC